MFYQHLRSEELCFTSLKEYLPKLFGFALRGIFVYSLPFTYLWLCINISMVSLDFYFIAPMFPSLPFGNPHLTVSSCVLLTHPHLHCVFLCVCIFSISSNTRYSRTILCISFPSPRISHFFRKPWFLLQKNGIRNQDLDARLLLGISTGVLLLEPLSSSLIEPWNYMWVYTNPCIYIYLYESSCININFILYLYLDILIY